MSISFSFEILVDTGLGQPKLSLLWFHIQNVPRPLLLVLITRYSPELFFSSLVLVKMCNSAPFVVFLD